MVKSEGGRLGANPLRKPVPLRLSPELHGPQVRGEGPAPALTLTVRNPAALRISKERGSFKDRGSTREGSKTSLISCSPLDSVRSQQQSARVSEKISLPLSRPGQISSKPGQIFAHVELAQTAVPATAALEAASRDATSGQLMVGHLPDLAEEGEADQVDEQEEAREAGKHAVQEGVPSQHEVVVVEEAAVEAVVVGVEVEEEVGMLENAAAVVGADGRIHATDLLPAAYFELAEPLRKLVEGALYIAFISQRLTVSIVDLEAAAIYLVRPEIMKAIWRDTTPPAGHDSSPLADGISQDGIPHDGPSDNKATTCHTPASTTKPADGPTREEAIHVAFVKLPSAARAPVGQVCELVGRNAIPILTQLGTNPLVLQPVSQPVHFLIVAQLISQAAPL